MARYDKYDPISGGFRAPIAVNTTNNSAGNPIGYGIDANGRAVVGAGNSGIKGLLVITEDKKAGEVIDIMTDGEIVELAGLTAGTTYYADNTTGIVSTTSSGGTKVGFTIGAKHLIVRTAR